MCLQLSIWSIRVLLHLAQLDYGSPTKEIILEQGLRQCDPLSPFLILIVVEGLNELMRQTIAKGTFTLYKVGLDEVGISLLQFAEY
ncbi:hypothetical protein Lalb_Chr12g0198171 [Lupinus albus]|uniref:Reverse transcriptase domain-containing protein n=1 Tax=Lupinus albus TaxID=3870 RepID=A0A6A4PL84_LUPAL|nr:hypothetical protein Lalb_Chr12g0198171 [Lupinus albus]